MSMLILFGIIILFFFGLMYIISIYLTKKINTDSGDKSTSIQSSQSSQSSQYKQLYNDIMNSFRGAPTTTTVKSNEYDTYYYNIWNKTYSSIYPTTSSNITSSNTTYG